MPSDPKTTKGGDEYHEAMRPKWIEACKRRMARIDSLSPEIRRIVHIYGWEPVALLMDLGAKSPAHIEHIIRACIGLQQNSKSREDRALAEASYLLRSAGYLVVKEIPTEQMVAASIMALNDAGVSEEKVERPRKHAIRLIAANVAGHVSSFGNKGENND